MTTRRRHLSAVQDRHWCWYTTPAGGQPAFDEALDVGASSTLAQGALIRLLTKMERYTSGLMRERGVTKVRDKVWEMREKAGNFQIRLLFASHGSHLVILTIFHKDYPQLKPADVTRGTRLASGWTTANCSGIVDFNDLRNRL